MTIISVADELAMELDCASQQQNWAHLQQLDDRVAQMLSAIADQEILPAEAQLLRKLKHSHQRALERCQAYQLTLKADMENRRNRQEGITAYAMIAIAAYQEMAREEGAR
ncbi:hypothetical protein [Yersinia pekkanenii]|uniref:Flagellar protein lafD n=1 Tax=Yersinia pekkanenii TaxID=1288385 RepID=A0A0T9P3Z2_9GAMM|nr:hypothetical protein [Yersinia pekkanenii]CNH44557.1 putative flagellar protein lafD [Yersinia pekkanenii]CRY67665.1 putative flagellar protein lafD [Yersinia pekkanenii]